MKISSSIIGLLSFALSLTASVKAEDGAEVLKPFNGKDLSGWELINFGGQGSAEVKEDGELQLSMSELMTGIVYTNDMPYTMDYEITLESRRINGDDFFCGLTFPVASNCVSLILGGWGGVLTGISSIDYLDASENETTDMTKFELKRWYKVKVHVKKERLQVWLDDKNIVDVETENRKFAVRPGDIESCQPFGLATWQTAGGFRNIALRKLPAGK